MLKKIVTLIIIIYTAPFACAIERNNLNIEFFSRFNDEYLVNYINEALENNHDVKRAAARTREYREQTKISFGKELPSLSVGADYLGVHIPRLDNFRLSDNAFILPFRANYEADFLLKNRDKTKSMKKSQEISELEEKAVYLTLLTDTATVYVNILEYDKLIENQNESINISKELLSAEIKKYSRGTADNTKLNNLKKNLIDKENYLKTLKKEREVLLMQLAVLTGNSPICTQDAQRGTFENFEYTGVIPEEIESDVIFSRPDTSAAEKQLEKAQIDIRVARKEFFPNFNIIGIWAFNTLVSGTFFSWNTSLAALLAGATQDIFKGGQKIANLRFQKAKYEELLENYRQINLEAVKEVNTALCYIQYDSKIEKNKLEKVNLEYKITKDAEKKLNSGVISYPEYKNNVDLLLTVKNEAIQAKNQRLVNYFTLYKAVGGQL